MRVYLRPLHILFALAALFGATQPFSGANAQIVAGKKAEESAAALARARAELSNRYVASGDQSAGFIPQQPVETRDNMIPRDIAVLQVLDKVSARTTQLRINVGSTAMFGLLVVGVKSCQIAPPGDMPESAAFLEVSEIDVNSLPRSSDKNIQDCKPVQHLLYSGWMFASSPALASMENPIYDVRVISCDSNSPPPSPADTGENKDAATQEPESPVKPPVADETIPED